MLSVFEPWTVGLTIYILLWKVIGGGISATTNSDRANIGSKVSVQYCYDSEGQILRDYLPQISLAGFVLQGAFFAVFSVMYTILLVRIYTQGKHIWARDSGKGFMRDWRGLAAGLYIGCLFIIVRLPFSYRSSSILRLLSSFVWDTGLLNSVRAIAAQLQGKKDFFISLTSSAFSKLSLFTYRSGRGSSSILRRKMLRWPKV